MASSSTATASAQDNTKKEDANNVSASEPNNNNPSVPTNHHPPSQEPYPQMGYPAPQGYYQGYPPQYPGHTGYPGYPYPYQPQAPPYYATTNNQSVRAGGSSLFRGIIFGLTFLVLLSFTVSSLMWLILRPQVPRFQIDTLTVSNFNASAPQFNANWDANFTVTNTNHKLRAYFDLIQSFVIYKNEVLAMTMVAPISIETEKQGLMQVKMSTYSSVSGSGLTSEEDLTVREINEEKNTGKVSFDIRFDIKATLASGTWHIRRPRMTVFCENLVVEFGQGPIDGAVGTLKEKSQDCLVYA